MTYTEEIEELKRQRNLLLDAATDVLESSRVIEAMTQFQFSSLFKAIEVVRRYEETNKKSAAEE